MHEYRVVERWTEEGLCVLRCASGRYHVARALNFMPAQEAPLNGDKPRLGFSILVCPASGAIFRLIFESINDGEPAAVIQQLLSHPSAAGREISTVPVWPSCR
jgi:hypothetical protein